MKFKVKYIRWIGAFGKGASLHQSFNFEFDCTREVACTDIDSTIAHSRVGLVLESSEIKKSFNGDCWSVIDGNKLKKTRNCKKAKSNHKEFFCVPKYKAIIVKDFYNLSKNIQNTCIFFAKKNNISIINLTKKGTQKNVKFR